MFSQGIERNQLPRNGLMRIKKLFKLFNKLRTCHFALTSKEKHQAKISPIFSKYLKKHLLN